jgi:hypothetical protein
MYLDKSFGGEQPVSHAHEQAQELHLSMAMYMGMSSTAITKPLCFLRPTSGPGEYVLGLVELGGCKIALSLSHSCSRFDSSSSSSSSSRITISTGAGYGGVQHKQVS